MAYVLRYEVQFLAEVGQAVGEEILLPYDAELLRASWGRHHWEAVSSSWCGRATAPKSP